MNCCRRIPWTHLAGWSALLLFLAASNPARALEITGGYPPNGTIDARSPSVTSWTDVSLDFDANPGGLGAGDFSVSVTSGAAPQLSVIGVIQNTIFLELDAEIPRGAWMTITHVASGTSHCLGSLPGDVNGDARVCPSDIFVLNDLIQNPGFEWQDMNGDGSFNNTDTSVWSSGWSGIDFDPAWRHTALPDLPECPAAPPLQCSVEINAVGSRYLELRPDPGPYPVHLVITCPSGSQLYLGAPGLNDIAPLVTSVSQAAFLTPAQWGAAVYVTDTGIAPSTTFSAHADFVAGGSPYTTLPESDTTWSYGDVDNDGLATYYDILDIVEYWQGNPASDATLYSADIAGSVTCLPDGKVDFLDVSTAVLAFQGVPYPCPGCP